MLCCFGSRHVERCGVVRCFVVCFFNVVDVCCGLCCDVLYVVVCYVLSFCFFLCYVVLSRSVFCCVMLCVIDDVLGLGSTKALLYTHCISRVS